MTEFKMNLEFEGEQPLENFDKAGRTVFEVSTTSIKAPQFSYENDLCEYPSDICSKLASVPAQYYAGVVGSLNLSVDPWRFIVSSAPFIANTPAVKYVRFDVKVIVRIVATPGTYGVLLVSHCPVAYPGSYDEANGDPILIDASKGDTTEFILPWEVPYEFYNLSKSMNIGRMVFSGYGFRTLSTSQYPWVEVLFTPVNIRAKGTRATLQMDAAGVHPRTYPAAGFLAGIAAVTSSLKYGSDYIRGVTGDVQEFTTAASELYNEALPYVDKLKWRDVTEQNQPDPVVNVPGIYGNLSCFDYVPANSVTRPQLDLIKPYHLGDIFQTHSVLGVASIPCVREVYRSPAEGVVKSFNFEPGILEPGRVHISYVDYLSRMFRYWRGSMEINFCIYMPALSTATFEFFFRNVEGVASAAAAPVAVDDVWAFKKEFTLRGSGVMSVRLPYISSQQWTRVGLQNTLKDFYKMWEAGLVMTRANSMGDTSMLPMIVVLVRPGPDFQFKSVGSCTTVASAALQMKVRTEFKPPEEEWGMAMPCKYRYVPEDSLTLEALCNRWSSRVISQSNLSNTTAGVPLIQVDNLDYIMSMFAYQRGSVRWLTQTGGTSDAPVIYKGSGAFGYTPTARIFNDPAGRGVVIGDPATNPITKFETVWDSTLEWGLTKSFVDNGDYINPSLTGDEWYGSQMLISNFAEQSTFAYAAAGRGFQLARLLPPLLASAAF